MRSSRSWCVVGAVLLFSACGGGSGVNSGNADGPGTGSSTVVSSSVPGTETTTTTGIDSSTTSITATTVAETTSVATTIPATAVPATTAPATTTPATSPPATTAPSGLTALPTNTNLQPAAGLSFTVSPGGDFCTEFIPPGWVTEYCESFVALANFYAVVQREAGDGHYRVVVMVPTGSGNDYVEEYEAQEPGAGTWSAVTVVHGSFHFGTGPFGGDAEGLWVGYRYAGTGGYLDLDVLEWFEDGSARRGALKELAKGAVDVRPGGAAVVSAVYAADDPTCCPSSFLRREMSWSSNRWRIDPGILLAPDDPLAAVVSDF